MAFYSCEYLNNLKQFYFETQAARLSVRLSLFLFVSCFNLCWWVDLLFLVILCITVRLEQQNISNVNKTLPNRSPMSVALNFTLIPVNKQCKERTKAQDSTENSRFLEDFIDVLTSRITHE